MTGICAGAAAGLAGFTPWSGEANSGRALKGYIRTNWSKDPLAYGGYSYVAKGASRRDTRELRRAVAERVFFAGEATNPVHNSTVHAAHQSGLLAVEAVAATRANRIAIVGAGMAGLTAAYELSRIGRDVTVFEARERIGGRVWTSEDLGVPLDLGASWIHSPDGNPLTVLADQAGQNRVETGESGLGRGSDGRRIDYDDLPEWVLNELETQISAGADAEQINQLAYWRGDGFSGSDVIFPGGYAEIFSVLQGDYATELSRRVEAIEWRDSGVTLTFAAGDVRHFDAVVVTVPLGVLKRKAIRFDPPLPERKRRAIERLGMGLLDKVYLLFDEPFWDDATWIATPENGLPRGQFNLWLNMHKYVGEPIVVAFNGASPAFALAEHSDQEVVTMALQTLEQAYPAIGA